MPVVLTVILMLVLFAVLLIDRALRPGYFTIERIYVADDLHRVDPLSVERKAWRGVNGNYFSVDLIAIEEQLKKMPGIYQVSVRRVWPDTLRVSIVESDALAKWTELHADGSSGAEQFINLPPDRVLHGVPALAGPAESQEAVFNVYHEADHLFRRLGLETTAVNVTAAGHWTLQVQFSRTDSNAGFVLVVGRHDPVRKVTDFAEVFDLALRGQLALIEVVDLRYPSGLAVRWRTANSGT
jgi:cell division protein FtsQ